MLGTFTIVEIIRGIQRVHYTGLPTPYVHGVGTKTAPRLPVLPYFPPPLTLHHFSVKIMMDFQVCLLPFSFTVRTQAFSQTYWPNIDFMYE